MSKYQKKGVFTVLLILIVLVCSAYLFNAKFSGEEGAEDVSAISRAERAVAMSAEGDEGGISPFKKNISSVRQKRNGIIRLNIPANRLSTSEMGIPVGEALAPPLCPPPPVTQSFHICYLKKCSSHRDCPGDNVCCFNGCIRTCTEPMDQPAAFDWVEDTSKILPILGIEFDESHKPFFPVLLESQNPEFAAAEGGEELVHIPGDCYVSATQYQRLKEFMQAPSIKECRCNDGEVVCDVRSEKT